MIINIALIINIIVLCLFVVLYFFRKSKSPKQRALVATLSGVFLVIYIFCLFALSVNGIMKHNFALTLFLLFAAVPFIIGRVARFETLSKFLFLQIFAFALSIVFLIVL